LAVNPNATVVNRQDQRCTAGDPGYGEGRLAITFAGAIAVAIVWAYWPTLTRFVHEWDRQPDYSHGYLVPVISAGFIWARRGSFPRASLRPSMWGLAALALAGLLRVVAGIFYLDPIDGWTLPLTIAGAVLLIGGTQVFLWSLPFLWFMVPIPYSAERWLSVPLQAIATKLSTASLVILGQPAIAEGNVITLDDHQLFIEEACSGLRILVGIFALAFAFVLFSRWSWWQKTIVLVSALPVAIVANVGRIVCTALLQQYVSSEAADKFSHDLAGFVMIPVAAFLFWCVLVYLSRLLPEVEDVQLAFTPD
jgi:exosortase